MESLVSSFVCFSISYKNQFHFSSNKFLNLVGMFHYSYLYRHKGGAVVRTLATHQCGPGSNPGAGMWVEFVVGSLPCCERFFSGYSAFPLSPKTNISKFQFDQESGRRRTTSWMCYLQIIIHYYSLSSLDTPLALRVRVSRLPIYYSHPLVYRFV